MGKVILGMTISLDGFVNDRHGDVQPLYPDFEALQKSDRLQESIRTTGAVVMGRHAFAMGDPDSYVDNYEYQAPIFVFTHHPPEKMPRQSDRLTFTFVTDGLESAIVRAKAAAGEKDVTVIGGASTAQQLIQAGLADEIELDIMPILLGEGLRIFEHLGGKEIQLEKIGIFDLGARTNLAFRVIK